MWQASPKCLQHQHLLPDCQSDWPVNPNFEGSCDVQEVGGVLLVWLRPDKVCHLWCG